MSLVDQKTNCWIKYLQKQGEKIDEVDFPPPLSS